MLINTDWLLHETNFEVFTFPLKIEADSSMFYDNTSSEYRFKSFFGRREIGKFYYGVEDYIKSLRN